ncbi:hypothetical protein BJF95_15675 [Rhizobium oryziradicis]|uniref:Uncharacterized protein n=1 Tax=Rhizobium oryziradicis TaxID=1867956 RepID=A0A1Q8ZXW0_9HYPH|nr:hypothetical protein [Rhizobium oryziradicis]OLP46754.1 hypothetical protein BJF95_15675 [Rhizobium oryziradicis]
MGVASTYPQGAIADQMVLLLNIEGGIGVIAGKPEGNGGNVVIGANTAHGMSDAIIVATGGDWLDVERYALHMTNCGF